MTSFLAFPPANRLEGTVRVPPSKSATNRALLLAALSETPVTLVRPLESGDTAALERCLAAMGARFEAVPSGTRVRGPLRGSSESVLLDAGESGTAARFLLAIAAATPGTFRLTGSPRLSERPMGALSAALRELGADIVEEGAPGGLPILVRGRTLPGGRVAVDASRSSQFLSALLLLGAAGVSVEVRTTGPVSSAPYVALTIESLRTFGHAVSGGGPWRVERGRRASAPDRYEVPGDFSSAIPILAAAGIAGGEVRVSGLAWPSPAADALAVPVLNRMGVDVTPEDGDLVARAERDRLKPVEVDAADFPDSVPALAALAAFCRGRTRFRGIAHLRFKESDRLQAISRLIAAAGGEARAEELEDGLAITGSSVRQPGAGAPIRLPTFGDHRIAMAAGLLSLRSSGLLIEDPDCVAKSYPDFFRDLDRVCRR